jgi:hypothetical protein
MLHLFGHDFAGLTIITPDADVEIVAIKHEPYFRGFAGRRAFNGHDLGEIGQWQQASPAGIVQSPINDGRSGSLPDIENGPHLILSKGAQDCHADKQINRSPKKGIIPAIGVGFAQV